MKRFDFKEIVQEGFNLETIKKTFEMVRIQFQDIWILKDSIKKDWIEDDGLNWNDFNL